MDMSKLSDADLAAIEANDKMSATFICYRSDPVTKV
jgi:hypothetical protein